MRENIEISVIVPCYNSSSFLEETVASILGQEVDGLELVLVDDGSTDDTRSIIEKYKSRATCIFGRNEGASSARNKGTAASAGKYLQYVDSDDVLLPGALAARLKALEETGADVAYGDWQFYQKQPNAGFRPGKKVERRIEDISTDTELSLFTHFWAPPVAYLFSREIVGKIAGWHPGLPVIQDARFTLDIAKVGAKFVYVPGVSAYYRVHGESSLSKRNARAFAEDVFVNAKEILYGWTQAGALSEARRAAVLEAYTFAAREMFLVDKPRYDAIKSELDTLGYGFRLDYAHLAAILNSALGYSVARFLLETAVRVRQAIQRRTASSGEF